MDFSGPIVNLDPALIGGVPEPDHNPAGPAHDGHLELIWIVDDDEDAGELNPPFSSDDEDESEEDYQLETDEEEDEDPDDDEDWDDWLDSPSEDSGYDSMYEEEYEEDDTDDDDIRPRSPLVQSWRLLCPPLLAHHPVLGPVAVPWHQELPGQLVGPPGIGLPPAPRSWEECVPSTSGLSSATKRSREEGDSEQVNGKRLRLNCEESQEEPVPSTSGLSSFTNMSSEESYRDSAPSTSGSGSFTVRRHFPCPFEYSMWADDSDSD